MPSHSILRLRIAGVISIIFLSILNPIFIVNALGFDELFTRTSSQTVIWFMWCAPFLFTIALIFASRQIVNIRYKLALSALSSLITILLPGDVPIAVEI
jgi:hypothetical protein